MNGIEFSDGDRTDFPAEWGRPPGSRFSEERASWVLRNVEMVERPLRPFRKIKRAQIALANDLRMATVAKLEGAGRASGSCPH